MREKIAILISFIAIIVSILFITSPSTQSASAKVINTNPTNQLVLPARAMELTSQLSHLNKTPPAPIVVVISNPIPNSVTPTAPQSAPVTSSAPLGVDPTLYAEWTRVSVCEEGGWGNYGFPAYPNSLGISATNWYASGGTSDLSISAQIAVAEKFRAQYGMSIPDQNGCAAW